MVVIISFTPVDAQTNDRTALIAFMTSNEFPFHVRTSPSPEQVEKTIDEGGFDDEDTKTYWIDHDGLGRIGTLSLEDLTDATPLFDLRLGTEFRGRGLGRAILEAATELVFTTMEATRFEGQTREDNYPMRATFLACGWVKEAHYREAWPTEDGAVASVAYAILRRDWESGTSTDVPWDDFNLGQQARPNTLP